MSKTIKQIFISFLFISLLAASVPVQAQIPENLILSLNSGNAKTLAGFFNQNVELVIGDNDNVYSKAQAQQIVANFFKENQPDRFAIIHEGGKEGAKYVIGNLTTLKGNYRVYFLLKESKSKSYIHQLRIEK